MAHEVEHRTLARFLEEHSLKHTKQREAILDVFLEVEGHVTSDDLYQRVRAVHPQIGYTTVYRTMKLLCDAGLAHEHNFDGLTRYEIAHEHHDHLVCVRCGKIIEFECEMIETGTARSARTRSGHSGPPAIRSGRPRGAKAERSAPSRPLTACPRSR
jgi:Fur family ferric uptake transcriptional regulator